MVPKSKFVAVSSTAKPYYSFFAPIVSRIWAKHMDYTPIVVLCKDHIWSTPYGKFILDQLHPSTKVMWISSLEPYKDSTITQTSRVLVACDETIPNDAYILTSDIDMFPLSKPYFHKQDWSKDINIMSADAYADITKGLKPPRYPMCYLGARKSVWLDMMNLENGNDIQNEVVKAMHGRADSWYNDEEWFMSRLCHRGTKYTKELMIRKWPNSRAANRLDRDAWNFSPAQKNLIDCHSLRPGHTNIPQLTKLFNAYFKDPWYGKFMWEAKKLI